MTYVFPVFEQDRTVAAVPAVADFFKEVDTYLEAVWQTEEAARAEAARKAREAVTRASSAPTGDVWAALARCESGMTNANTGNGFYGFFQFLPSTWRGIGESGMPHEHSYEEQRAAAERLQARSGWGQWPACSRKLGLR